MSTVAIYDDFLAAFSRLTRAQQRKVREFNRKFAAWPTAPQFRLEKPEGMRDERVRTVTLGPDTSVVLLRPERAELHVLLWVDSRPNAIEWARNRSFVINERTGALQAYDWNRLTSFLRKLHDPLDTPLSQGEGVPAKPPRVVFASVSDEELASLGIPSVLVPAVRAVRDAAGLRELGQHLPVEGYESIVKLAAGYSLAEVRGELPAPAPDTADVEAALAHPDSRRRFAVARSADDLEAMLNAPLEKWRLFLHPSQEALVHRSYAGPARVLGGAGTGKTVVAMHRARHLARSVFAAPTDRVLLTTFTTNLAENLRELMQTFCGPELARIEIVNLHAWAMQYVLSHGLGLTLADDEQIRAAWEEAMEGSERDRAFYEAEWRHIVQANGVTTLEEYLDVPRPIRGPRLTREEKQAVWPVLERYRDALRRIGRVEWNDLLRTVREHVEARKGLPLYRAAVIDEAQDFGPDELHLLRALVPQGPDDLFIVGDAHQRIYGQPVVFSRLGIDVRGRTATLRINYRTTEQIADWALELLDGLLIDDLDGGRDDPRRYVSLLHGVPPEIHVFGDAREERQFLSERLAQLARVYPLENVCVVARSRHVLASTAEPAAREAKLGYVLLEKQADREAGPGLRLATMHRVKGLEFACVVVVGLTADQVPYRPAHFERLDAESQAEHELQERCLLYVASTRARDRLVMTAGGRPSKFLGEGSRGPGSGSRGPESERDSDERRRGPGL